MHSSEEDSKIVLGGSLREQQVPHGSCVQMSACPRGRSPRVSQWHPPTEEGEEAVVSTWGLHLVSKTWGWKDRSFSVLPSCPETLGWRVDTAL